MPCCSKMYARDQPSRRARCSAACPSPRPPRRRRSPCRWRATGGCRGADSSRVPALLRCRAYRIEPDEREEMIAAPAWIPRHPPGRTAPSCRRDEAQAEHHDRQEDADLDHDHDRVCTRALPDADVHQQYEDRDDDRQQVHGDRESEDRRASFSTPQLTKLRPRRTPPAFASAIAWSFSPIPIAGAPSSRRSAERGHRQPPRNPDVQHVGEEAARVVPQEIATRRCSRRTPAADPADDPGEQLAQRALRVTCRRSRDRDHRGELGVSEAGESAGQRPPAGCSQRAPVGRPPAVRQVAGRGGAMLEKIPAPMIAPIPNIVRSNVPRSRRRRCSESPRWRAAARGLRPEKPLQAAIMAAG